MAQGVYTRKKRFTFVKGWLTGGIDPADGSVEVGEFTDYPMEVIGTNKLDKVAEVFHRVSDAIYKGGAATADYFGAPLVMSAPTAAPAERAFGVVGADSVSLVEQQRGFVIEDVPELPASADNYLEEAYPIETYYPSATLRTAYFREINGKEMSLQYEIADEDPLWGGSLQTTHYGLTAFGYFYEFSPIDGLPAPITSSETWTSLLDNTPDPPVEGMIQVQTTLLPEVAYILADPADSIFSPNTRFFLKFSFQFIAGVATLETVVVQTTPSVDGLSSPCNYIIRLSSGDITCPLYFLSSDFTTDVSGLITGATDFIHEAVEWFPYQDADGNVWNPTTGLPA